MQVCSVRKDLYFKMWFYVILGLPNFFEEHISRATAKTIREIAVKLQKLISQT